MSEQLTYDEILKSKKPFSEMEGDEKFTYLKGILDEKRPFLNPNHPSGFDPQTLAITLKSLKESVLFMFEHRQKPDAQAEKLIQEAVAKAVNNSGLKAVELQIQEKYNEMLSKIEKANSRLDAQLNKLEEPVVEPVITEVVTEEVSNLVNEIAEDVTG